MHTFFILDFGLHVIDGIGSLNIEGDCFASERLHKNLHCPDNCNKKLENRLL